MNKKLNKVLTMALTGAMAMSALTGCSSKPGSTESAATNTVQKEETKKEETTKEETPAEEPPAEAASDVAGVEGWAPFDSKVTLQIPVYDRGVEGVPTVSDNYWTKWVQEHFGDTYNIEVKYVPITRSDVMTDYALLAASDSLPTILMEYDYPKVSKWADDGYLTTFDLESFGYVAPNYYKRMVETGTVDFSMINNETYFALAERPNFGGFVNFVRMDWLEQVGYDHVPANRAEYVDAMTKIQKEGLAKHPQGGSMVGVGADQNYAFRDYPFNEEDWAMYSSIGISSLGWNADYKLLKRANEDYALGFTNPEYYITDAESNKAAFINGEVYSFGGYMSSTVDWLNAFYEKNPDAKLAVPPVTGQADVEGGTTPAYRADNPFGMIVGFSSSATEDELKAAWMYMEWMTQEDVLFEMQWGVEGENYTIDAATNLPVAVADYNGDYKQGYNNSKDYWCITIESRNAGTAEEIITANAPKGLPQDFAQIMIDNYYATKKLEEAGYACYDPIFSVVLEAESEYSGTLTELYKEYRDKLTMCKPEEFDALYESLAQKYAEAGYKQVIEDRLEAYQNGNSTKLSK